uniref:Putative ubiquitin conjugating enzyme 7 n=1 Tax=Culex tarsalis TaxID=7177 RepID=A0A1Q3EWM3_CULTA
MSRSSSKGIEQKRCPLCCEFKSEYRCMVLINCRHTVCRSCLRSSLTYCGTSGFRCPVAECNQMLEEAEMRDILEHSRPIAEPAPVANHWNWSSRSEEKKSSRTEVEYSSYFRKKDFPELTPSVALKDSRSSKYGNVMDEPVPSGLKTYEPFKSSKKETTRVTQNEKHSDVKDWDLTAMLRLQELIADKMHKVVDFVFVASKDEISHNMNPVACLICQAHIKTSEGVSFPFCSSYFCRNCLAQPEPQASDVILLYSDSTDVSKNCAAIINGEMRGVFQKSCSVPTSTVHSLVSIYENVDKTSEKEKKCTDSDTSRKSLDTKSSKTNGRSSQQDSISDAVLFRNVRPASCELCCKQIGANKGVILRNCYHVLCEGCLISTIMTTLETSGVEIRCPMVLENHRRCETLVQEREIKRLLTDKQYEVYERKCLEAAVDEFSSRVHCLSPTCNGWIVIEGYKESFVCPVCCSANCLSCKAIHNGKSCSTYQTELECKSYKDLSLKAKLMALDAQQKVRCPKCRSDDLKPPCCNFIRCISCDHVFIQPKPEWKK